MNIFATPAARRAIAGTATVLAAAGMLLAAAGTVLAEEATGTIEGRLWFDRDYSGTQDAGEPGYTWGTPVVLYKGNEFVGYYETDDDGRYLVSGLEAGQYRVANMDSGVFAATTPEFVDLTLVEGQRAEVNFGMRGGTIAGPVWLDRDGDGKRQDGEPALPDTPLEMIGPAGLTGSTTANDEGYYLFQDLPNGLNYQIVAPAQEGRVFTTPGADSAIDPATGQTGRMEIWRGTGHVAGVGYVDGMSDPMLNDVTSKPNRKTFTVGEKFTLTVPMSNAGTVADTFTFAAGFPEGLTAIKVDGLEVTKNESGALYGKAKAPLGHNEIAYVAITFLADKPFAATSIDFTVYAGQRGDANPDNNSVSRRGIRVAGKAAVGVKPVANTSTGRKVPHVQNLASTGASPLVPVLIGAGLLAFGTGLVLTFRRRRPTGR